MYILVDERHVIVACSNTKPEVSAEGYPIINDVIYLNTHLEEHQSNAVTSDCVQKKCFCRNYKDCFGVICPHYAECSASGTNQYVYTNPEYGEVCPSDGKDLIVTELKKIKPELDVNADDTFPVIADKIDTMLDDATVTPLNLGENETAYTGSGLITGVSEVIEQVEELPQVTESDVGNVIKCGTSIYIGEEV